MQINNGDMAIDGTAAQDRVTEVYCIEGTMEYSFSYT
jgi:hypothetical protein